MDTYTKKVLGRIYASLLRIEKHLETKEVSDAEILEFEEGFEYAFDNIIKGLENITGEKVGILSGILNEYHLDQNKLNGFGGYYDIAHEIERSGITRTEAIEILKSFKLRGQFLGVIKKIEEGNSPAEFKPLNLEGVL